MVPPPPPPLTSIPPAKKQKIEPPVILTSEGLLPESDFLARHKDPVSLEIRQADGGPLSLSGLDLSLTVSGLKEQIAQQTGLTAGKQKLTTSTGLVMKNSVTLAYYNLVSGSVLSLSTKERGGRK
jgi:splicing factor 3A subunit 1